MHKTIEYLLKKRFPWAVNRYAPVYLLYMNYLQINMYCEHNLCFQYDRAKYKHNTKYFRLVYDLRQRQYCKLLTYS